MVIFNYIVKSFIKLNMPDHWYWRGSQTYRGREFAEGNDRSFRWCWQKANINYVLFSLTWVYLGKGRVSIQHMQMWQAMCILCPRRQDGMVFIQSKRKLREGKVRTLELYYEHRVLPLDFSCRFAIASETSVSPSSSHKHSWMIVFFKVPVSTFYFNWIYWGHLGK